MVAGGGCCLVVDGEGSGVGEGLCVVVGAALVVVGAGGAAVVVVGAGGGGAWEVEGAALVVSGAREEVTLAGCAETEEGRGLQRLPF